MVKPVGHVAEYPYSKPKLLLLIEENHIYQILYYDLLAIFDNGI